MFGERAHHRKARAGIDEAGDVNPERHMADRDYPDQHWRTKEEVARQGSASAALVAPCIARQIADEPSDQKSRAQHDASKQGRLGVGNRAPDRTKAAPSGLSPVIALWIVEGIGQICVAVMRE